MRAILLFAIFFFSFHLHSAELQDWKSFRANAKRMEERILKLSEFGRNPEGGVSRVAFSDADIEGRRYISSLMQQAGLKVRVDTAGNIIGRRDGRDSQRPVILFGSHIDSVPHGGNYDGDVGVIGALECIELLNEKKYITNHPLEMIVFSDEEGGLVGSRAIIGELSEEALSVKSHTGKTIRQGILAIGGDPERLAEARRDPAHILAFIELHIEQGGILDSENIDIGVVEGIVGINWWEITILGFANHAGTTPMDQRKDALVAAAKIVDKVNYIAANTPGRHVATVGRIQAEPGAPNVIPGRVVMSLEIRDLSREKIDQIYQQIQQAAQEIAKNSGTTVSFSALDVTAEPAPTDLRLRKIIDRSARDLQLSTRALPSGAGHDAQDLARIVPTGMIFVPSVEGISHSPKEFTHPQDMANGATVLLHSILRLDTDGL